MNIVIVGHVDHGKSTVVGRLLADTGALPQGKLDAVRRECERTGKPFEYAFLLDALSDEQDQGITIDTARCFFKSATRDYIIIDAPGHIEFLKNMISGAARAEAAVLVIDAKEGVRENSRRHGYILSMLGIRQVVVVREQDGPGRATTRTHFARDRGGVPRVPRARSARSARASSSRSARDRRREPGARAAASMPWYEGPTLLETLDALPKAPPQDRPAAAHAGAGGLQVHRARRRPPHRRRAHRGRAGRRSATRWCSRRRTRSRPSRRIEGFNAAPRTEIEAGLVDRVHADRGDLRHPRRGDEPRRQAAAGVSTRLRANLIWLGKKPFVAGARLQAQARHHGGAGAHPQDQQGDRRLARPDADARRRTTSAATTSPTWCSRLRQPIAFDLTADCEATGRFVIVDGYDVAGGGIITAAVADELRDFRAEARTARLQLGARAA